MDSYTDYQRGLDFLEWWEESSGTHFELQIKAARKIIHEIERAENKISKKIDKLFKEKLKNPKFGKENELVENMELILYFKAAYSAAVVSVLSPMTESFFKRTFSKIKEDFLNNRRLLPISERFLTSDKNKWNCEYYFQRKKFNKSIIKGINQLSTAINLNKAFPVNWLKTFTALFEYRNIILHRGMEWPMEEKVKFLEKVQTNKWPNSWFSKSIVLKIGLFNKKAHAPEPKMIYLTQEFAATIINTIEACISGLGTYVKATRIENSIESSTHKN